MAWPPKDGTPWMPSNATEFDGFDANWCAHCSRDAAFREDMDNNDGCEILAAAYRGEQQATWFWRKGVPHCANFSDDPANPVRCPLTLEMDL
ncbi:p082 [Rhizobium phage 16-3]|uniref:p082 n=1 Tax=Rhizobium phage 16-3 TaxID=10704 RepID=UPI00017BA623|nr:p082 [Rhizobium phage 16-3]ABF71333.1 p082 [Rhizobium phage 16-3]